MHFEKKKPHSVTGQKGKAEIIEQGGHYFDGANHAYIGPTTKGVPDGYAIPPNAARGNVFAFEKNPLAKDNTPAGEEEVKAVLEKISTKKKKGSK